MTQREIAYTAQDLDLELERRLPLFGHRNWIVVADAAYPAQSNPGIATIVACANHLEVLEQVMTAVESSKHIRGKVYTDLELDFVAEDDAPGISEFRKRLSAILTHSAAQQLAHEEIIAKLDQCAQIFKVLVIKTDLTIPYTSVFLELGCGYWSGSAEERLRQAMRGGESD